MTDRARCCPPLVTEPLSLAQAEALVAGYQAVADPVRLRLLSLIASAGDEICVSELQLRLPVAGPTVSHHLKVLREVGLIRGERRGTWIYYRVVPDALQRLSDVLAPS